MEALFSIPKNSVFWAWMILLITALGTYSWRGLGVLLSGKLTQESPWFRWITCVTYAMVASLVIRIIVLPVGILAQMPLSYRLVATGTALAIMMLKKNSLVLALSIGTLLMSALAFLDSASR
ncbi:MAG: AzlD domain-containing protein [Burkholderiales bacterium]|jgi:branched-subunit amino acid transport protein